MNFFSFILIICNWKLSFALELNVSYSTDFLIFNSTPQTYWIENRYPVNMTCAFLTEPNEKVHILEWFVGGRREYQWIIPTVSQFFNEWADFSTKTDNFLYMSQNDTINGSSIVSTVAFATEKVDYVCAIVYSDSNSVPRTIYRILDFRKYCTRTCTCTWKVCIDVFCYLIIVWFLV